MAGGIPALGRGGTGSSANLKHVPAEVRHLALWATISTLVQSALWIAMCTTAQLSYSDALEVSEWRPDPENKIPLPPPLERFPRLLAHLYFKDSPMPRLPDQGLLQPSGMLLWTEIMTASSVVWFFTSAGVIAAVRLGSASAGCVWVYMWVAASGVQTVLDIMLGALLARDLALLVMWKDLAYFPGESTALLLCPTVLLLVALRGGALLLINFALMLKLARKVADLRCRLKQEESSTLTYRSSVVGREAPIDAFLYRNSGDLSDIGARNPAFEPDADRWSSFRPAGHRDKPTTSKDDEEDDFTQHLSWMAEVDKHVNGAQQSKRQSNRPVSRDVKQGRRLDRQDSVDEPYGVELRQPPGRRQDDTRLSNQPTALLPRVPMQPNANPIIIPQPDYTPPMPRSQKGTK